MIFCAGSAHATGSTECIGGVERMAQWVQEVRDKANLPARLVLWDGHQFDFGSFSAPQVTLKVNSASALPLAPTV